jgi:hypothetical protein
MGPARGDWAPLALYSAEPPEIESIGAELGGSMPRNAEIDCLDCAAKPATPGSFAGVMELRGDYCTGLSNQLNLPSVSSARVANPRTTKIAPLSAKYCWFNHHNLP